MDPIPWSASRIEKALFCMRAYYYEYVSRERSPYNGPIALGIQLHRMAEDFYRPDGTMKYKSPETFANTFATRWKRIIRNREISGREIKFSSKEEPWKLLHVGKDICRTFYQNYENEEPPIFVEQSFDFMLDGRWFKGRIDEIRKGYVIRDHKTGRRLPKQMQMDYDPDFTLYVVAFGALCHEDRQFAERCGVSQEDAEKFAGHPDYASDLITVEYHQMRTGEILTTNRTNAHYHDFCEMLDDLESRIANGKFTPNRIGDNCDYCLHNEICDRDTKEIIIPQQYGQLRLFGLPIKEERPKQPKLKFPRRRKK